MKVDFSFDLFENIYAVKLLCDTMAAPQYDKRMVNLIGHVRSLPRSSVVVVAIGS